MLVLLVGGWSRVAAQAETAPEAPRGVLRIAPAIDARVIATNNAGVDSQGQIQRDVVTEVQPSIAFERRGPRLTFSGLAAVSELSYLHKVQPNRTLARGRLDLASKVVDNLLYLDGWARVDPTFEDPFAARPEAATAYKIESHRRYGISPYLLKNFGDVASLLVRSDYVSARVTDASTLARTTTTSIDHTVAIEHKPMPLGTQIEAKKHSESNKFQDRPILETESGRFWLTYAIDPQLTLGADVGRERVASPLAATFVDRFYGGRVQLKPTERTNIDVKVERRYFGSGWDGTISHRTRMLGFSLHSSRLVSTQSVPDVSSLAGGSTAGAGGVPPVAVGGNTAVVPDSGLLTQYASVPQLRQSSALEISLRGRRNLVFLQLGYLKTEVLQSTFQTSNATDILEQSAVLGWNSQMTPVTALNLIAEWHHAIRLAGPVEGNYSTQRAVRGELVFTMSPRSFLTLGARKSGVRSNFLTATDTAGEVAAYAGIRHRF